MKTYNYYTGILKNSAAEKPISFTFRTKKDALKWFDETTDADVNKRVICFGEIIAHSFIKKGFSSFEVKVIENIFD